MTTDEVLPSSPFTAPTRQRHAKTPREFKIVALRECVSSPVLCDQPQLAHDYWKQAVEAHPYYHPEVECLVALLLNTRRRIIGHHLISTGILDTILVHSREVFRAAIIGAASAVVLMHNHPSGDPSPSEADIKVTRDMIRAGQLLKIELLDHVIVGRPTLEQPKAYASLRELGYFYT